MPALSAAGAGEAMGEDAAVEIAAELTFDVSGYRVAIALAGALAHAPVAPKAPELGHQCDGFSGACSGATAIPR